MELPTNAREIVRELFELYADDIYNYAYYMLGRESDAEDVVQETFLRVVRAWEGFRNESQVKTWLWSITRNCIYDVHRKRGKQKEDYKAELLQRIPSKAMSTLVEVEDSIAALPPPQRQVVILRMIQDMTTSEAAATLGWSETKVRSTLHRAVVSLRKTLADSGFSKGSEISGG